MIYQALTNKIRINPSDFSVASSFNLGEVRARYAVYGGNTSVSLQSDKLVLDFPNLLQSDLPIVADIMHSVHDAFPKAFSDVPYNRIEVLAYEHLQLQENEAVARFLDRYA